MRDRVIFPASGFRLSDAVGYYDAVAPYLLPHLKNRPLSFRRYPDDIRGDAFWEKDAPSFTPRWVKRVEVPRRSGRSAIDYIVVNDRRMLQWLVESGGLELHPFLHRATALDRPTEIVFDLDPGSGAGIVECSEVAVILRDHLRALNLESFAKVSGSKGMQLYVPLNTPGTTHEMTETFARLVADELARLHPRRIVSVMTRSARARKVFIDWSQNADYKTTVSVYSLRTNRDEPLVSMPLQWREVEARKTLEFAPHDALKRVRRLGDLFAQVLKTKQRLPKAFLGAFRRLAVQPKRAADDEPEGVVVNGIRLPRRKSQSGRRLFVLTSGEAGHELWLDIDGRFRRFILRPDRGEGDALIAVPAGQFAVAESWYRGEVQPEYRSKVEIEDIGTWEAIEGSFDSEWMRLWFTGRTLSSEWVFRKTTPGAAHRSWTLEKPRAWHTPRISRAR